MGALGDADDDTPRGEGGFDADLSRLPTPVRAGAERMLPWSARRDPLSPRQRSLRAITILIALAAALIVILQSAGVSPFTPIALSTPTSASTANPVPAGADILGYGERVCLRDAAWSPDSRHIAVLVEAPTCALSTYQPGVVRLYDVTAQRTSAAFPLDAAIFAALGVAPPPLPTPTPSAATPTPSPWQTPTIFHQSVDWSRDGGTLAIAFLAIFSFAPNEVDVPGLVLLSSDGSREHVLLGPENGVPTGGQIEWDLSRGTIANVAQPNPISSGLSGPVTLPAGLGYAWRQDGVLAPLRLAPAQASNPVGDATFSIWQPGQIDVGASPVSATPASPPTYVFAARFAAWSPDGRYLISDASAAILLEPADQPPPTRQLLETLGIAQIQVDTSVGPCLESLLATVPTSQYQSSVDVAWRPDGLVLALSTTGSDLTIYECATGRKIASASSKWPSDDAIGLSWSPDGAWLLLPNGAVIPASQLGGG